MSMAEKKPRKQRSKFKEVERIYFCNYQGCNKGYGRLNHLNDHVKIQEHGEIRKPSEFALLRKQLRRRRLQQEILQESSVGAHPLVTPPVVHEHTMMSKTAIVNHQLSRNPAPGVVPNPPAPIFHNAPQLPISPPHYNGAPPPFPPIRVPLLATMLPSPPPTSVPTLLPPISVPHEYQNTYAPYQYPFNPPPLRQPFESRR